MFRLLIILAVVLCGSSLYAQGGSTGSRVNSLYLQVSTVSGGSNGSAVRRAYARPLRALAYRTVGGSSGRVAARYQQSGGSSGSLRAFRMRSVTRQSVWQVNE